MERKLLSSKRIQAGSKKTSLTVLRAAERVFAKQGFAGSSMRDISRESGVSQPLIHHYFKTKRALYNEIKRQMILRFEAFLADTVTGIDSGMCAPEAMLRRTFEFMKENPNLVRLGAWAQLEGDIEPWPGEVEARESYSRMFSAAQQSGAIRKHLDPRFLTILMEGLMFSWWEYREAYLRLHEGEMGSDEMDGKVLEAMVDVFLKGTLEAPNPLNACTN
jgi:TetR/AcrR family transcriptional regulator